jgi:hypothetical protein
MPPYLRQSSRASMVLLVCLLAPACGLLPDGNLTPQQQEQANLRSLQRVAQVTERVGVLVASLQQVEIALHNAGRVPNETHIAIQTYLKLSAGFVVASLETAKDQTKPAAERRDGILAALKLIDGFQTEIVAKIPDEGARTQLGMIVLSIQTILTTWALVT